MPKASYWDMSWHIKNISIQISQKLVSKGLIDH